MNRSRITRTLNILVEEMKGITGEVQATLDTLEAVVAWMKEKAGEILAVGMVAAAPKLHKAKVATEKKLGLRKMTKRPARL